MLTAQRLRAAGPVRRAPLLTKVHGPRRATDRQGYTTDAAPRRSLLPRAVVYAVLGTAAFYGGSAYAAQHSPAYRGVFEEHVYGGKELLAYLSDHDLREELHTGIDRLQHEADGFHLDERVSHAADSVRSGVSSLTGMLLKNEHVQHTREGVEKRAADMQTKLRAQLDELKSKASEESAVVEDQIHRLRASSGNWLEQAQELAESSLRRVRERAAAVAGDVKETALGIPVTAVGADAAPEYSALPVSHEAPAGYAQPSERRLEPPSGARNARLRDDPATPRLPKLAPSLQKLTGSEPVVAQLAGTIDELAAYLRETPSAGAVARNVLDSAQADMKHLCARLEQIKKTDAKKLDLQLAKQAREYEKELAHAADAAHSDLAKVDKNWSQKMHDAQQKQTALCERRLAQELETQSAIINERLQEEVLAQGIELQRKWMKDIHARVEQERAGRLARLDELAADLHRVEQISAANAKSFDDGIRVNALNAALRAVRQAIDENHGASEEGANAYVRRSFEKELDVLRMTPGAREDELVATALAALARTGAAKTGVESVPTLNEWFGTRLAPRLRHIALLPEQGAGVLSYVASVVLSPFVFLRKGLVEGNDIASTVARAEWHLEHQDLDSAAREVNQLRGWSKVLAQDWLAAARKRLEVDQALDIVDKEASFNALLRT
ncbi:MICOS complex subunit mic60 [Malassezia sp. CBS 17886]|nr:MICOS complex subunit mic60 [Malassezia sp. CBS 17886]